MDMRLPKRIYHDYSGGMEILSPVFPDGVHLLRICICLYYGAALLLCGDVYVAILSKQIWKSLVRGV